jgi:hypothetical protein
MEEFRMLRVAGFPRYEVEVESSLLDQQVFDVMTEMKASMRLLFGQSS